MAYDADVDRRRPVRRDDTSRQIDQWRQRNHERIGGALPDLGPRTPRWILACGVLAGVISGLLGVGGGLVVSPMLLLSGLPLRRATGTALAVIPVVALMAVVADLLTLPGNLRPGLALAVARVAAIRFSILSFSAAHHSQRFATADDSNGLEAKISPKSHCPMDDGFRPPKRSQSD